MRNPNRSPLVHFDSSLRVVCAGSGELGRAYIPAGLVDGGRAKDMSASFDVPAFAMFIWLISQQLAVLFSQNKSSSAISH
jgi:hypothetical protein